MTTIPIVDTEATGIRIRQLLDDANISIRDLQNVMGFTTPQAIYKWLHGKCLPSIDNLVVLAELLNTTVDELIIRA